MLSEAVDRAVNDLPRKALSVRQPWAWAIVHGGKRLENRSWRQGNPCIPFRGPFCIHAAMGMTRDEYEQARYFMADVGVVCPPAADLIRGGIIGTASVTAFIRKDDPRAKDQWFFGPAALVLDDVKPIDPIAAVGALGFFDWKPGGIIQPAKPWMLPKVTKPLSIADKRQEDLL